MRGFLLKLLLFGGIAFTLFALANAVAGRYNGEPAHYAAQFKEAFRPQFKEDGIILGSSHATHGIRPTLLDRTGTRFYNYALNGTSPDYYLEWYSRVFRPNHPVPRACILHVDWFISNKGWLFREFEHDSQYLPARVFRDLLFGDNDLRASDLLMNRYPVLKHRKNLKSTIALRKGDERFVAEGYDRGFVPYRIPYAPGNFHLPQRIRMTTISRKDSADLYALVDLVRKDGTQVILLMAPEFGIDSLSYTTMSSIRCFERLAKAEGIPFLNYNTDHRSWLNDRVDHFSDWGHLNDEGSKAFSTMLANDIRPLLHDLPTAVNGRAVQ